ncbi:MAG: sigma-70 family RNA polymerase sigma factor [Burkholderiales bacterium]|nr:sigma-70 family RNA polymerase sigma factor [Bacteroidia bacterium]
MKKADFAKLIIAQGLSLKKYATHFTKITEDANDLVQETLLKAITCCDKFEAGNNIKGWLFTILKNTYINNYKKQVKKNKQVTQCDGVTSSHLMYSASRNGGESKFILDDLNRALTNLPVEYGFPFSLFFEGYKYQEIADQLVLPIGTVKTRIFVARQLLKKNLKPYDDQARNRSILS